MATPPKSLPASQTPAAHEPTLAIGPALANPALANPALPNAVLPTTPLATADAAEHFIPIRQSDLVELLCGQPELSVFEASALARLAHRLEDVIHAEYHQQLTKLSTDYAPFDPDSETARMFSLDAAARAERLNDLFSRCDWLLGRANFTRLPPEALQEALAGHTHWGINLVVDFSVFERLEIYVRGEETQYRERRGWRTGFRVRREPIAAFRRLVVLLKLRANPRTTGALDTEDVYLKLFKDIPRMDLEMLLPGTRVCMSLIDRTKIALPTLSGLAMTGWKLFAGAVEVAASGMYNSLALLGLAAGSIGYSLRSFHGYLQTRQRYQLSLTESLYYQNLDNNAGVLTRLLAEAEEQENREALLAYFFLWRAADPLTADELDRRIEALLVDKLGRRVDFEVDDALDKLERFGLIVSLPGQKLRAVPLAEALTKLAPANESFGPQLRAA